MSETRKTESVANQKKPKRKAKVIVYSKKRKYNEPETVFIQKLQQKYKEINQQNIKSFTDLPLSPKTLKGLKNVGYIKPTEIQRETIGLALQGKDILGAAQTGSGKTLAFIIPILEVLYCKQWTHLDGLGALVITPTRELAYQIFETLRKVGIFHDFSAGLVIGGKDLKFERKRMDQCNIIICTPGRLLQHMDENPLFDCVNMQILVLDEADRCLDMGFEQTMNAIIANLPPKRQTLLFSATQTKSVKDLARLSLKDPCYVSVHEHSEYSTPSSLQQNYVVCRLEDKVSILWSFIKNHLKQKTIIFLSSCKQVKYIYEIFCRLRPGVSLLALYGTLHQLRRMEIYESFCRKTSAVLFATDLAARGLDFPEVHWVIQADCPEDAATYIHRAGRTARYHRGGESLLLLLPSEISMIDSLKEHKIPINKIEINPLKLNNPVRKIEAFIGRDEALKETAQRAFVSYAKAVFLMKNKEIFDVESLDTDAFAKSLGLAMPPRIRFLQRMKARKEQASTSKTSNTDSKQLELKESDVDDNKNQDLSNTKRNFESSQVFGDNVLGDGFVRVGEACHDTLQLPTEQELLANEVKTTKKKAPITKAAVVKLMLKKNIIPNKKIVFDEDSEDKCIEPAQEHDESEDEGGINIKKVLEEKKIGREMFKERVKAKHKIEKKKMKEKKKREQEEKDDFGSESEDEPDLSWLPDPDKIYGKEREDENHSDNEREAFSESNSQPESCVSDEKVAKQKSAKRKLKIKKPKEEPAKKKKKITDLGEELSVNQAEELAMMLLKNK